MEILTVDPAAIPKPFKETPVNLRRCEDVLEIMRSLHKHWPLTVRSVYYKVISSPNYRRRHWKSQRNHRHALKNPEEQVGEVLKYLRLTGGLPWHAINDESRIVTRKKGVVGFDNHVIRELDMMYIDQFDRCNAAEQENYLEVWVEKNGLVHIAQQIADNYCRRTCGCKGFPSVSFLNKFADRGLKAQRQGQDVKILYFGDLDPAGWLIPKTIMTSLSNDHGIDVDVLRCGLNPSDVTGEMISIPLAGRKPIKDVFAEETGLSVGYELDLLDPDVLQEMVGDALEAYTDREVLEMAEFLAERNNIEIDKINGEIEAVIEPIREKYKRQ